MRKFFLCLLVVFVGIQMALAQDKVYVTSLLPEGEGKDLVATLCVQCHDLKVVVTQRKNLQGWRDSIYDMVSRGAMVFEDEMETISQYLAEAFGSGKGEK